MGDSSSEHVCHSPQQTSSPVYVSSPGAAQQSHPEAQVSNGKSCHLHAWRLSCSTTKQQDFRERSLGLLQLLEDSTKFANWATGHEFDPLCPTAAQIAAFLYELFDTRGLSLQTIKGYRSCLASVLSCTGMAAKTISDMIMSMELQRPRLTPVLMQWDLGIVLGRANRNSVSGRITRGLR